MNMDQQQENHPKENVQQIDYRLHKIKKIPQNRVSKSEKAGIEFPVGKINRLLKSGKYTPRVGQQSAVTLSAILEYLTTEVNINRIYKNFPKLLEQAGKAASQSNKSRINPKHILSAIKNDEELEQFLGCPIILKSGQKCSIEEFLQKNFPS